MTDFDPDKFDDKYVHYLQELELVYKSAFEYMNDRYDSELVHAIDQRVLNNSEPVYEGEGEFSIQLPENPGKQLEGVILDEAKFNATLEKYVARLEAELRRVFGFNE